MARIVVAVADPEIRSTLQRLYHQVDYSFVETNGDQCLTVVAEEPPDVILLDSDLPDTDTFTLCARLFAITRAPILMLIPNDTNAAESAFAAGASDVITRPLHLTTLQYRLRHFLQISEMNILLQNEEWYHSIVENALGGIYRSTPDGRFLFANQTLVRMLGYRSVEDVLSLWIPSDVVSNLNQHTAMNAELEATGRVDDVEQRWKRRNGETIIVSLYVRVIRDLQGRTLYYEGIALDITERKRIETAEREQRQLLDGLRTAAATLNNVLNLNLVLDNILTCVCQVMPDQLIDIFLIEDGIARSARRFGYVERDIDDFVENLRLKVSETPTLNEMATSQGPLFIEDVWQYPGWVKFEDERLNWARAVIGAPILMEGEVIGFLLVDSEKPGTFSRYQADALQAFADQAGIAIHNARLYEETRRHAQELEKRVVERTAELERGRAQLQAIMDSINEGVNGVIFEPGTDHVIYRYTNRSLEDLFGYSADEWDVMGMCPSTMSQGEYENMVLGLRKVVLEKGVWQGKIQLRHKDGHDLDISLTVTRLGRANMEAIGSVSVFRDIGAEIQLEAQQARFVASAAHELRTPITSLKTRLYLAQAQTDETPKHLRILDQIIGQMQTLVEDLLDLSRFENGLITLHLSPIDLQRFIEDIVEIQGVEAQNRGIQVNCQFPDHIPSISADSTRLYQVITNLLTNAITYTPSGEHVTIRVGQEREADQIYTTIDVADTGTGIAPEHLPHIFEPFYRANRGMGRGMGLGLSISKDIIELHGGRLTVTSEIGKGTTFRIWLPEQAAA